MPDAPPLLATALALRYRDGRGGQVEVLAVDRLALAPGGSVCITGPSGAGKSSLLHLLAGLMAPSAGTVDWGGTVLSGLGEGARAGWRRRMLGYLFQDVHLVPELSPLANVLLPAGFTAFRVPAAVVARGRALLDRFEVPADRARAGDLSRGEAQRVALARALILDPPVILADEPTASLDAANTQRVAEALAGLSDEGRSLIAVSHDPALIERLGGALTLTRGRLSPGAFRPGVAA